jgi:hypothetical protein
MIDLGTLLSGEGVKEGFRGLETGLGVRVRRCAGIYHYFVPSKIRGV